jgi:hypothetical protein
MTALDKYSSMVSLKLCFYLKDLFIYLSNIARQIVGLLVSIYLINKKPQINQ